jgi:hypothetical protein
MSAVVFVLSVVGEVAVAEAGSLTKGTCAVRGDRKLGF